MTKKNTAHAGGAHAGWEAQVSRRKVYDQIWGYAGTFPLQNWHWIFECRMGNRKS